MYPQNKKPVFNNLNLKIKKSEFVDILGPSGTGKTTLLNIISDIDLNFKGEVRVLGKNLLEGGESIILF